MSFAYSTHMMESTHHLYCWRIFEVGLQLSPMFKFVLDKLHTISWCCQHYNKPFLLTQTFLSFVHRSIAQNFNGCFILAIGYVIWSNNLKLHCFTRALQHWYPLLANTPNVNVPFGVPLNIYIGDAWKLSSLVWEGPHIVQTKIALIWI